MPMVHIVMNPGWPGAVLSVNVGKIATAVFHPIGDLLLGGFTLPGFLWHLLSPLIPPCAIARLRSRAVETRLHRDSVVQPLQHRRSATALYRFRLTVKFVNLLREPAFLDLRHHRFLQDARGEVACTGLRLPGSVSLTSSLRSSSERSPG